MKKVIKKLLLLVAMLSVTFTTSAYDFEVDGIYYDVVSFGDFTCKVVNNGSENLYVGDFVIPTTVNYNNKTLTVTEIGAGAFEGCFDLTSITIPNTISLIDNYAFKDCPKLEYVTIEDGEEILTFNHGSFKQSSIISVYLGRNILYHGTNSDHSPFYGSTIKDVTIGNFVTKIFDNAFNGCYNMENVTIGNSVKTIGKLAFQSCRSLTNVVIPNSVTQIGYSAFSHCDSLKNISLGNTIIIDEDAFSECRSLTNVIIPNSVTKIIYGAFWGCSSLASITIGTSVVEIGKQVFENCDALTTLFCLNTTPPSVNSGNFTNNQYMNLNVYVPNEALETYQRANIWRNFWNLQGFDFNSTEINDAVTNLHTAKEIKRYDAIGRAVNSPQKGLNIIKMSDGTTRKILVK